MSEASINIISCTCEHLVDPLGLDVRQPRLSWQLTSDLRGVVQQSYQVLVATSPALLDQEKADLWDSGKVDSDQSVDIVYAGKALEAFTFCFWKVRVWAGSDGPSPWSAPAMWSMGPLEAADWPGSWISRQGNVLNPDTYHEQPAPLLRTAFEVDREIQRATVHLCGLGFHELFLNGERVGDHQLDPVFSRYDKRVYYVSHDVTEQLQRGANGLGVLLYHGWYNQHQSDVWDFHKAPWRGYPCLRLLLRIEYTDGSVEQVSSSREWKTAESHILHNALRTGTHIDSRREQQGWSDADFNDVDWQAACEVRGPAGRLEAQKMPPIKIIRRIEPVSMTEVMPGSWVVDLGENIAGWAALTVTGQAGARVTMQYAERLNKRGLIDQKSLKQLHTGDKPFQTDVYMLRGEGKEIFEPHGTYHGFRYIQVKGDSRQLKVEQVEGCVVNTAVRDGGSFTCSNELLNKIQELTRRSYLGNYHGMPTDCPQREKNGWTGDAHLAAEAGLMLFQPQTAYSKWMNDCMDSQRDSGELPAIIPTGGWGFDWGNGPAWDSAYPLITWYLYLYCGDRRILEQHYRTIKKYVDYIANERIEVRDGKHRNIVQWGLGDWVPPCGDAGDYLAPAGLTSTAFYFKDLTILSLMAEELGREKDAKAYSALAKRVQKALNQHYFTEANGAYSNGSQTAQTCALYMGVVPTRQQKKVLRMLVADVKRHKYHLNTGILGTKWLFRALSEFGQTELAFKVATREKFPSYGYWIEQGATTLWENWKGGAQMDGSLNHIMFGDISAWMMAALTGIQPDPGHPGFKHFYLSPEFVDELEWAEAEHQSPYGQISVRWERTSNGGVQLAVTVPCNAAATLKLPDGYTPVTEGRQPVEQAEGVKILETDDTHRLLLSAGRYVFGITA